MKLTQYILPDVTARRLNAGLKYLHSKENVFFFFFTLSAVISLHSSDHPIYFPQRTVIVARVLLCPRVPQLRINFMQSMRARPQGYLQVIHLSCHHSGLVSKFRP